MRPEDEHPISFQEIETVLSGLPVIDGISTVNLLDLPDSIGRVVRTIAHQGSIDLVHFAAAIDLTLEQAQRIGDLLVEKGYLRRDLMSAAAEPAYCVYFARMRKRNIPDL